MIEGYYILHQLGYAHSVEVYKNGEFVGGLYGVSLGAVFFGESMFTWVPNGSKAALVVLVRYLRKKGFQMIDSQVPTEHLSRFGARSIPRVQYLSLLRKGLEVPTYKGPWNRMFPDFPQDA
jgi:leucyl/phenylalanyl-tRNA--protein transferase